MNLNHEIPTITTANYGSATGASWLNGATGISAVDAQVSDQLQAFAHYHSNRNLSPESKPQNHMNKRIVRVYIADIDSNIPLEKSLLHSSEEKLTDLNDQELFFEIPINEILKKHNEFRATLINKSASEKYGKEVKLEPLKIRELKMHVVTIASF